MTYEASSLMFMIVVQISCWTTLYPFCANHLQKDSITGTSGVIAWELGRKNIHLIVMWSVPYNLNFYSAYFGFGMVRLSTKFTRDMLPYWYRRMYDGDDAPSTFT